MGNGAQLAGMGEIDTLRRRHAAPLRPRAGGIEHVQPVSVEQRGEIGSFIIRSLNWRTVMKNSVT